MSADQIIDAVGWVDRFCPDNAHLIEDEHIERAVLAALGSAATTGQEQITGAVIQPRVIYTDAALNAESLWDVAIGGWTAKLSAPCHRCFAPVQPVARLWIAAGASVVEIDCCSACRDELTGSFGPVHWQP